MESPCFAARYNTGCTADRMIRMATTGDLPRLLELLHEMQGKSKYAGNVDVDVPTARSLLMTSVQRNGGTNNGSTIFCVAEHDGRIEGFVLGILDRVYHIGNRLTANDIYLYCTEKAKSTDAWRLTKQYVDWALANPKVADVKLSHTDVLGTDGKKISKLYSKLGFRQCGTIWERVGQ